MHSFHRLIGSLSRGLNWIAAAFLVVMMSLIVANVVVRTLSESIRGAPEMVSYSMVIVVAFAAAYAAVVGGHVKVELLTSRLPRRVRAAFSSVMCFLGIVTIAVIAWRSAAFGLERQLAGELSPILLFPVYPFRYLLAFGCAVLCLVLLLELVNSLAEALRK